MLNTCDTHDSLINAGSARLLRLKDPLRPSCVGMGAFEGWFSERGRKHQQMWNGSSTRSLNSRRREGLTMSAWMTRMTLHRQWRAHYADDGAWQQHGPMLDSCWTDWRWWGEELGWRQTVVPPPTLRTGAASGTARKVARAVGEASKSSAIEQGWS